ncbi:ABC transporter ATP-binding protein [Ethanoligenens sp.]|uniref:ABC transporter ATP-binding protein n=1 Tax=Ethanoligenens sp. TaxID=2099655 RepID=UPI0039EC005C
MSLVIKNINKNFTADGVKAGALHNVNLELKDGEFVCVLGPSGCGKSTLLNIVAGLDKATSGTVELDGKRVCRAGPDRAVMFQESALFPWMRAVDNVAYPLKVAGVPKEERIARAMNYLKLVRLSGFAQRYPHELSGGMRQRVALARALILDSKVLLMDEPFAALDSQTKTILQLELQRIWLETKRTIFFVTHNVEEAVMLADRVVVLSAHPGTVKKEFRIELARPRQKESVDLTYFVKSVMAVLKEEVEKVAKSEFGDDWSFEKDTVLPGADRDLGANL